MSLESVTLESRHFCEIKIALECDRKETNTEETKYVKR